MIVELNISNFAIIDDLKINFVKGFNILTGETGAGKSIIVEGMGMILGQRANRDLVRKGSQKSTLEGLFYLEDPVKDTVNEILKDYGIDIDPNNYLLISREIHKSGRSVSRINGRTVTLTMLNKITVNLVDIHGQHEHQSLLNISNHMKLIDTFGDKELKSLLQNVEEEYRKLQNEKDKLSDISINNIEKDREIDILRYQIDEINRASLLEYDEKNIVSEYEKMKNIKEIGYNLGEVSDLINNNDYNDISILDNINKCVSKMNDIKKYDSNLTQYNKILEDISFQVQDLGISIRNYLENLEVNEENFKLLEEKIDITNSVKKKYGNTIEEILQYKSKIENRLETLLNNEKIIENINNNIIIIEDNLTDYCTKITEIRKELSKSIEVYITKELEDLNMDDVVFKVDFQKIDKFTMSGWDKIEFLISTNKGEDLKPLTKIVSGGEMSRIMLAFKSILAKYDNIPCLIFDEIDTGISGRTAQIVGEKIKMLSSNHQIICISHLPQIAALADTHFIIEKDILKDKTRTVVRRLNKSERIDELSRLLGGVDLTNTTKQHAEEMLEMSKKLKFKN